jgi:hypothetical protein
MNSINGVFLIPNGETTPRNHMSEIPRGMECPEDAISEELINIFDHTVAYREY